MLILKKFCGCRILNVKKNGAGSLREKQRRPFGGRPWDKMFVWRRTSYAYKYHTFVFESKKEPWQVVQPAMEHGSAYRATTTLRRVALPYYQRAFFCKGFGAVWAGATPCLPHFLRLPSAHFCALIVFIHHDCACAWSVMIAETATTPIVTAKACTTRMSNSLSCVRAFSMGSSPRPIDHGMNTVSSTSAHYRSSLNMSKLLTNNKISVESHLPVV